MLSEFEKTRHKLFQVALHDALLAIEEDTGVKYTEMDGTKLYDENVETYFHRENWDEFELQSLTNELLSGSDFLEKRPH